MDPVTEYCYGCARDNNEKKLWKDPNTKDKWKIQNLKDIENRMEGWQLESFEKSYNYKCLHGISLEKKRKMKFDD